MEFVVAPFLDALCATLRKKDLKTLQEIGPWSWTVETYYNRRREFKAFTETNLDGTKADITIYETPNADVHYTSLTKHDRIVHIWMELSNQASLSSREMPLERYRTKVVPVLNALADTYAFRGYTRFLCPANKTDCLFSGLRAPAQEIKTAYFGGRCVKFIEEQVALGRLEHLELHGNEWPDSMEASLKAFLRSPNFVTLDLSGSNLTVDLDMLICIVQRFCKGDLRKGTLLQGKPSEEMKALRKALLSSDISLSGRLPEPSSADLKLGRMEWTRPDHETLHALITATNLCICYAK
uniref:Leucine-rich repeat-containing protein 14 n=1 Tax=Steinernema glaseri TaxID=37863 RepID=A0A1I7XVY0_9BILA